jgi:hypothetical protein
MRIRGVCGRRSDDFIAACESVLGEEAVCDRVGGGDELIDRRGDVGDVEVSGWLDQQGAGMLGRAYRVPA